MMVSPGRGQGFTAKEKNPTGVQESRSPGYTGSDKTTRAWLLPRPCSMGNGQRIGRLTGFPLLGCLAAFGVLALGRKAVTISEPATQVDGLATRTAEGELRPIGPVPFHLALANGAA